MAERMKGKLRVVVVHPGCWCEGEHGFVLARLSEYDPPRDTVQLDNGSRFMAEKGDLAREAAPTATGEGQS